MSSPTRVLSDAWKLAVCATLFGAACGVDEIDHDGKACPCADGYVCVEPSNTCAKPGSGSVGGAGAAGSAATGGFAGVDAGGGGTTGGGSGGTPSGGGSGGTPSGGGSGGTPSGGGSGGTPSGGGSGGTPSGGGSGGTPSGGGSGGAPSGGGGSGGASTIGITCGTDTCDLLAQKCCHVTDVTSANGTCTKLATQCGQGFADMLCDEPADCASGVCCERIGQSGVLSSVKCESQVAGCSPSGSGSAVLVCSPLAPACPSGQTCVSTPRGYHVCQ